ncbi:MAG: YbbR-like domain-containing protein [Candidatus Krumholzibacteriota bacterium]|nr:YbbR-like domain-containing protein [Candidatus Krumholzibacteriota bacterium]
MFKALTRNLPVKLTSLALAILLWAMVTGQHEVVRQVRVPLELPALADSLMYLVAPPQAVDVVFRGSKRQLFWFRLRPPRLRPTFEAQPSEEPMDVVLSDQFLDLPRQFSGSVVTIQPKLISLQVTEVAVAEVPVRVVVGREPRHPYRLRADSELEVEPAVVRVRGPRDQVRRLPWVRTEPLDLSAEQKDGSREIALEAPHARIRFEPEAVRVRWYVEAWQTE